MCGRGKIKDKISSYVFERYIVSKYEFYDVTSSDFRVDASYGGSILVEITLLTSPYKIFLNDSNEHSCYFFKCYYSNF
jgi:hypothetical protein